MARLLMRGPAGALVILGMVTALVTAAVILGVGAAVLARAMLG